MSANAAVFNALDANGDGVLSREEFAGAVHQMTAAPQYTYAAAQGGYAAMPTTYMVPQVAAEPGAVMYQSAPTTYITGAAPGQTMVYGAGAEAAGGQVMNYGPATTTTAAPVYVQPQPQVQYVMQGAEQAGAVMYGAPQEPGAAVTYAQAPTVTYLQAAPAAEAGQVTYVQQAEGGAVQYVDPLPTVTYAQAPGQATYIVEGQQQPEEAQAQQVVYASPYAAAPSAYAAAPTVTYLQPGGVTYEGATQMTADGQMIVAPTYVPQQVQSQIPSFVAAPGSVTYAQAGEPQGSITYAQPGTYAQPSVYAQPGTYAQPGVYAQPVVPAGGFMQVQGAPDQAGAVMVNSQSMVAYPGGAPAMLEAGMPQQHPGGAPPSGFAATGAPASQAAGVPASQSAKAGSKKKDKTSKKKGTSKKKNKSCC